jgi:sugar lactone lactonase YvrE
MTALRTTAIAGGLAAALALPAAVDAKPRIDAYVLPEPTLFPEGVAYDEGRDRYFVSSQSNGAILSGDPDRPAAPLLSPPGAGGRANANGLDTDRQGRRLFVAGGQTAKLFRLNARTGATTGTFALGTGSYANDVGVTRHRGVFVTDSLQPVLWRVGARAASGAAEPWLDLTTTPIAYATGFNLNGIEATRNGRRLVAVQTNTGQLWRISTKTKRVREIILRGGERVTNGDGLVLRGRTLYVVRNAQGEIVKVKLAKSLASGRIVRRTTNASFRFPTTADIARGRMLVVNSQFDRRGAGQPPERPFTLSSIPIP